MYETFQGQMRFGHTPRVRLAGLALIATLLSGGFASAQYPLSGAFPIAEEKKDNAPAIDEKASESLFNAAPAPTIFPPRFERPRLSDAKPQVLAEDVASSSDLDSRPTAAELRQARAQYRSQQRLARMERNLWAGYEPLRPNWNTIPMMSSRYAPPNTILVPVYIFPR